MIDRFAWNCYHRADYVSPWTWVASGATFGEANAAGMLRQPTGEQTVIFGKCLPDAEGRPLPVRRRF